MQSRSAKKRYGKKDLDLERVEGMLMKRSKVLFILTFILALSIPGAAQEEAQAREQEQEGKWRNFEVVFDGGLTIPLGGLSDWKDSLGAKNGFHIGGSGGYYFTERICVGTYFHYTELGMEKPVAPGEWNLNFWMYDFGGYLKYVFAGESDFEPYVKLSGGAIWTKFPTWVTPTQNVLRQESYDPGFSMAVSAGVLYYTSDYGGVFLELGYHNDFMKGVEANYRGEVYEMPDDIKYLELRAGLTAFFGKEE